jgi:putative ABC transport system permease protein
VLDLLLRDGLRSVAAGLAAGLVLAAWLGNVMTTLLFQTSVTDPVILAGVAAFIVAVAVMAGYLPARAALRIDPSHVLRSE